MAIETVETKRQMIQKLQEINVLLANNQGNINPKKFAMVQEAFENLEQKMRTAFSEDDKLDGIIVDFEKEVQEQEKYIQKQESRIEKMKNSSHESGAPSDEESDLPTDILRYEE